MYIISSDGTKMGDFVEVSRVYNRILGWGKIDGKGGFTVLGEFPTESLAQASFEDYIKEFGKCENKNNFIYQIISVDKYHRVDYN